MTEQQDQQRWRGAPERNGAPEQERAAGNTDLAVRINEPITDLDKAWRLAANLSLANLLPEKLRGRKSDVFAMILYGNDLGLSPMQAIQGINVVEGRPSLGAATWSALMQRYGHRIFTPCRHQLRTARVCNRPAEHSIHDPDNTEALAHDYEADHDNTRCRLRCVREDGAMFESEWTVQRAVDAGLMERRPNKETGEVELVARSSNDKPMPWEAHTKSMLYARTMSEVCRQAAPAVALGFYSQDEAEEIARRERAERVESQRLDQAIAEDAAEQAAREQTAAEQVDEVERLLTDPQPAGMPGGGMPDADDAAEVVTVAGIEHLVYIGPVPGAEDLFGWRCEQCGVWPTIPAVGGNPSPGEALADHLHFAETGPS